MIPDPVNTMVEAMRSTLDLIGGSYVSMTWVDDDGDTITVSVSRTSAEDAPAQELLVVAADE